MEQALITHKNRRKAVLVLTHPHVQERRSGVSPTKFRLYQFLSYRTRFDTSNAEIDGRNLVWYTNVWRESKGSHVHIHFTREGESHVTEDKLYRLHC